MVKKSTTVVLSLPINLVKKIENVRNDLPRSLVYRRLLLKGLEEQDE
ncbi:MAG: hypothetical protein HY223_03345 [Thaumarchaeota archaeon]|nr:hypothetical protein [Nitrososphaerota archaeon]